MSASATCRTVSWSWTTTVRAWSSGTWWDVVEFSGSKAKTKSLGMMRTVDMLIKYLEHKRGGLA